MKKAMTTLVNEQRNAIENQKKTAELEDVKVFNFDTSADNVKNSAADFKAMLAEEENAALKELLEDKGYDNDRISTIINKAMAGETDELSKLYGLITKLIDPT
jgi:glutamate mutase epsilon subunit